MIDERSTKEQVLKAVKQNGDALQYASEALRNDKKVVMEAMKQDGWALFHASEALHNDRDFIVKSVRCLSDDSLYSMINIWIRREVGS